MLWCVSRAAPPRPAGRPSPATGFRSFRRARCCRCGTSPSLPRPTGTAGQRRPASSRSWCSPLRAPSRQGLNCRAGRERRSPDATGRAASPGSAAKPTAGLRGLMAATAPVSGPAEVMARDWACPAGDRPDRRGDVPGPPDLGPQGMLGRAVQKAPVDGEGADDQGRGPPPPRGPQTPVNGHKILGQRRLHASDAALYSHRTTGGTASGRIPPRDRDAGAAYGPASRTIAARKV